MSESNHAFALDGLTLSGILAFKGDGFEFYVMGSDADFGDLESEARVIASALMDGDLESIERTGNRELRFPVVIVGDDADALARGEALLDLTCRDARELLWTPPAENGATSVYDVQTAVTQWEFDDLRELGDMARPERHMMLIIKAYPFPRSTTEVVAEAIGSGADTGTVTPTVTTIYDGTSTTNWSAIHGTTGATLPVAAALGGGVENAAPFVGGAPALRYSATISMGTNRWLVVNRETVPRVGSTSLFYTKSGSSALAYVLPAAVIGTSFYYLLPASGMTLTALYVHGNAGQTITVRSVARQNAMPVQSTGRQLVRQFTVQGSARTQGSIQLSHDVMALGSTLVYTWRADESGYVPTVDTHLNATTSTPRIADSSGQAALGGYMEITSTAKAIYEVPADLIPEGTYNVLVRAKHPATAAAVVVTVAFETVLNGAVVGAQSMLEPLQWTNSDYRTLSAGAPILPPARVAKGTSAKVRITVATNGPVLRLDSIYLCNSDMGDLTLLDCGTSLPAPGGASNRAWIDTPTLDSPYPAIWVGTQLDRSDARHIDGLKSVPTLGHTLEPGQNNIFTVSSAYSLAAECRHYPRARSNVAKVVA